jgi:hypothetical protein
MYGNYWNSGQLNLSVSINGGPPIDLTSATNTGTFVGFTDTSLITSVVLTETGNLPPDYGSVLDLISVQQSVSATPLPAALPLFAGGLGALGLFGWRRKRRAAGLVAA